MELEIQDVQSSDAHRIPPGGITLGRSGTRSDVTVADKGISGRHARIYARGGAWFVEDLGSSNGTFVDGERISEPTRIKKGSRISLARRTFEVIAVTGDAADETAMFEDAALTGAALDEATPPAAPRYREPSDSLTRRGQGAAPGERQGTPSGAGRRKELTLATDEPSLVTGEGSSRDTDDDSAMAIFMATVPKAIAYYLAAVPLMLFNPIGTIKRGIAEPTFPALKPRGLIAYALPGYLLFIVLGSAGGIIATIVARGFSFSIIVSPLISLAIGVVASIMVGLIWHPLLAWWVDLLEGESNDVSRTNYFIMVFTAMPILAVANLLSVLLGIVPLPFIKILPLVIGVAANLLMALIAFVWFKHFRVKNWFQILILVAGGAVGVMGILGLVDTVRAEIVSPGSSSEEIPVARDEPAAAEREAAGATTKELATQEIMEEEAGELLGKTAALADGTTPPPAAPNQGAATTADSAQRAAVPSPFGIEEGPTTQDVPSRATAGSETGTTSAQKTVNQRTGAPAASSAPETRYQTFVRKRAAIEDTIDADPTLLSTTALRAAYKEMHRITFKLQLKHSVKMGKRPTPEKLAQKKVAEKIRDAEIYEQTHSLVAKLYRELVER